MPDTKALRSRIKSVDSTLHLTKAMGLVASSKIRRANEAMMKGRDYSSAVNEVISQLAVSKECAKSAYMQSRSDDISRTRIIIIAGDRGLAGGYNANIFRLAAHYAGAQFIPIGKRACDRYGAEINSSEHYSSDDAAALSRKLCAEFASGDYDRLGIIHTKYVSMLTQEAVIDWLLPLSRSESTATSTSIVFEPDEISILNAVVPEYVAGILVSAIRESFASEVAARRTAMDSAGKNAGDMIDRLQLEYNRARQGAITQEITEIVAGSGV
ncbi:MAG: ATP synthase F1 subunit gamma [Clostridiales bacterium]|nr:ATP synthase F1 subunit gamma [Clostridiales bacterium]